MNIRRWKKLFSTILADYCLDCWKGRNETIHGSNDDKTRGTQLDTLRTQVKGLYSRKAELVRGTKFEKIFAMPKKKRLRLGIHSTIIWVDMAEEALRLHREEATKNTIHQWLQP